jgi:hypothetical protein
VSLPEDKVIAIVMNLASEVYRPILSLKRNMWGEDLTIEYFKNPHNKRNTVNSEDQEKT